MYVVHYSCNNVETQDFASLQRGDLGVCDNYD